MNQVSAPQASSNMSEFLYMEKLAKYAVSERLAPRVKQFGLEKNLKDLQEFGYTVIENVAEPAFIDRLRVKLREQCYEQRGTYFAINEDLSISDKTLSSDLLLEKDPVFAEAAINPKVMTIVEYLCGQKALLSQLSGSVKLQGSAPMFLHCDTAWLPEPLPEKNAFCVACWYCDDITGAEAGATRVIPGSHKLNRPPTHDEAMEAKGAIPIIASKGSVGIWDGTIWHSNFGRSIPGERVLLHAAYTRLIYRTQEDYSNLGNDFVEKYGPVMADLLGRGLWFGNRQSGRGGVEAQNYPAMHEALRS